MCQDGSTVLHVAIEKGLGTLALMFIEKGANVLVKTKVEHLFTRDPTFRSFDFLPSMAPAPSLAS